jgi:hypothetical protein
MKCPFVTRVVNSITKVTEETKCQNSGKPRRVGSKKEPETCCVHKVQLVLERCAVVTTFFVPKDGGQAANSWITDFGTTLAFMVSDQHKHNPVPGHRPPGSIATLYQDALAAVVLSKGNKLVNSQCLAVLQDIQQQNPYYENSEARAYERKKALERTFPHGMDLAGLQPVFKEIGTGTRSCYIISADLNGVVMQLEYQKELARDACAPGGSDIMDQNFAVDVTYADTLRGQKGRITGWSHSLLQMIILYEMILYDLDQW